MDQIVKAIGIIIIICLALAFLSGCDMGDKELKELDRLQEEYYDKLFTIDDIVTSQISQSNNNSKLLNLSISRRELAVFLLEYQINRNKYYL